MKWGSTSAARNHIYFEPPGHEDSPVTTQNIPYLYKKLSKSRFSDPFFWRFLVISGLGSRIYIVKSAILSFWVFLSTFLHEITLKAIDIDNIGCLEPFLPLWEHFWNRVSVDLNCASDLTPRRNHEHHYHHHEWQVSSWHSPVHLAEDCEHFIIESLIVFYIHACHPHHFETTTTQC